MVYVQRVMFIFTHLWSYYVNLHLRILWLCFTCTASWTIVTLTGIWTYFRFLRKSWRGKSLFGSSGNVRAQIFSILLVLPLLDTHCSYSNRKLQWGWRFRDPSSRIKDSCKRTSRGSQLQHYSSLWCLVPQRTGLFNRKYALPSLILSISFFPLVWFFLLSIWCCWK